MSVNLVKKQTISLEKNTQLGLQKVKMGLGWSAASQKKSGFLGKIFSSEQKSIDLDASCLLIDDAKNIVDQVWFRKLSTNDKTVVHSGDNLTGEGDGDDETITVDLVNLPSNITQLVFVITSYRGQTFDEVENAFCRLVDNSSNSEIAKFNLSGRNPYTGQIMARLFKSNGVWNMQAIGEPTNGKTVQELVPVVRNLI